MKTDSVGNETLRQDLSPLMDPDNPYIQYLCADGEGNIYLSAGDTNIYVLDGKSGSTLFNVKCDEWINGMGCSKEGKDAGRNLCSVHGIQGNRCGCQRIRYHL